MERQDDGDHRAEQRKLTKNEMVPQTLFHTFIMPRRDAVLRLVTSGRACSCRLSGKLGPSPLFPATIIGRPILDHRLHASRPAATANYSRPLTVVDSPSIWNADPCPLNGR